MPRPVSHPFAHWLLLLVLLTAGCATSKSLPRGPGSPREQAAAQRLHTMAQGWEGTPYCLGGTTRRCIDCSAFVRTVYDEVFDKALPRTTEAQVREGQPVSRSELQAGDLVFFRTGFSTRHVGIYLADGRFLHASTSLGVTTSSLNGRYWRRHYWTARRLLADFPPAAHPVEPAAPTPLPAPPSPAATIRTGW